MPGHSTAPTPFYLPFQAFPTQSQNPAVNGKWSSRDRTLPQAPTHRPPVKLIADSDMDFPPPLGTLSFFGSGC